MSLTLAAVATQFLERGGYAPSTLRSYELTLLLLLQQYGAQSIDSLSRSQFETYLSSLNHLSYTTHRRHQAILQALLNYAVEQGYLSSNPIARLRQRKPDRTKGEHSSDDLVRYLSPEQLQTLYEAIQPDARLSALVRLLHRSGARVSEILALNLDDLDLDRYKVQVLGKGNKRRWLFYSQDAAQALSRYLDYYRSPGHPALFTAQQPFSGVVTRLSYATAYRSWQQRIAAHPSLQGARLHDLRHTFATERVGLMGIEELRALLGHESLQTTLRYQKVTSGRAEEVAQQALKTLTQRGSECSLENRTNS
jgi:integrase/recombinase XerD